MIALFLRDNRAFCKYVCPILVFQKITSRFELLKVKIDPNKCIDCGISEKNCPMDIKLLLYKKEGTRVLFIEYILCSTCSHVCPKKAVDVKIGLDTGIEEKLNFK